MDIPNLTNSPKETSSLATIQLSDTTSESELKILPGLIEKSSATEMKRQDSAIVSIEKQRELLSAFKISKEKSRTHDSIKQFTGNNSITANVQSAVATGYYPTHATGLVNNSLINDHYQNSSRLDTKSKYNSSSNTNKQHHHREFLQNGYKNTHKNILTPTGLVNNPNIITANNNSIPVGLNKSFSTSGVPLDFENLTHTGHFKQHSFSSKTFTRKVNAIPEYQGHHRSLDLDNSSNHLSIHQDNENSETLENPESVFSVVFKANATVAASLHIFDVKNRNFGYISKVFPSKAYGFIDCMELHVKNIFFHFSQVDMTKNSKVTNSNFSSIQFGHEVQFTFKTENNKPQAHNIHLLDAGTILINTEESEQRGIGVVQKVALDPSNLANLIPKMEKQVQKIKITRPPEKLCEGEDNIVNLLIESAGKSDSLKRNKNKSDYHNTAGTIMWQAATSEIFYYQFEYTDYRYHDYHPLDIGDKISFLVSQDGKYPHINFRATELIILEKVVISEVSLDPTFTRSNTINVPEFIPRSLKTLPRQLVESNKPRPMGPAKHKQIKDAQLTQELILKSPSFTQMPEMPSKNAKNLTDKPPSPSSNFSKQIYMNTVAKLVNAGNSNTGGYLNNAKTPLDLARSISQRQTSTLENFSSGIPIQKTNSTLQNFSPQHSPFNNGSPTSFNPLRNYKRSKTTLGRMTPSPTPIQSLVRQNSCLGQFEQNTSQYMQQQQGQHESLKTNTDVLYYGKVSLMKDNYGFIKRIDEKKEIFFHYSSVSLSVNDLTLDCDVQFNIGERNNRKCAVNISVYDKKQGRLIFEKTSRDILYGILLKLPIKQQITDKNTEIEFTDEQNCGDDPMSIQIKAEAERKEETRKNHFKEIPGIIRCGRDENYYNFYDADRHGNMYTLNVGDPVTFRIQLDTRDESKKAIKVDLDTSFFQSKVHGNKSSKQKDAVNALLDPFKVTLSQEFRMLYESALVREERIVGIVTNVVTNQDYGFIKCDNHNRLFFHCSELINKNHEIRTSDEVEFTIMEDKLVSENKFHATRIVVLPKGSITLTTVYQSVYKGTLYIESEDDNVMFIKYQVCDKVKQNENNSSDHDQEQTKPNGNQKIQSINLAGISSFVPEVRIYLEKNPKLTLKDLNEMQVFFQIQKARKLKGSKNAVNVNPCEWFAPVNTMLDQKDLETEENNNDTPRVPPLAMSDIENDLDRIEQSSIDSKSLSEFKGLNMDIDKNKYNKNIHNLSININEANKNFTDMMISPKNLPLHGLTDNKFGLSSKSPLIRKIFDKVSEGKNSPLKSIRSQSSVSHLKHSGFIVTLKENYGFIEAEDHEHEIFFHYSEITDIDLKDEQQKMERDTHLKLAKSNSILESDGLHLNRSISTLSTKESGQKIVILNNFGYKLGTEVAYTLADKDGKLCAKCLVKLPKGTLTKDEIIDDILYLGIISRPTKSTDQSQKLYYGQIKVLRLAEKTEVEQFEENSPREALKSDTDYWGIPKLSRVNTIDVVDRNSPLINLAEKNIISQASIEDNVFFNDKFKKQAQLPPKLQPNSLINFSTISLSNPSAMIIQDDKVVFKMTYNTVTKMSRAVQITPIRTKRQARIESTKGEYGFIAYKVEGRTPTMTNNSGENSEPSVAGNLFFHSTELMDCDMKDVRVGDLVEFNVVHVKKTNKYCAAKIRIIEKCQEYYTSPMKLSKQKSDMSLLKLGQSFDGLMSRKLTDSHIIQTTNEANMFNEFKKQLNSYNPGKNLSSFQTYNNKFRNINAGQELNNIIINEMTQNNIALSKEKRQNHQNLKRLCSTGGVNNHFLSNPQNSNFLQRSKTINTQHNTTTQQQRNYSRESRDSTSSKSTCSSLARTKSVNNPINLDQIDYRKRSENSFNGSCQNVTKRKLSRESPGSHKRLYSTPGNMVKNPSRLNSSSLSINSNSISSSSNRTVSHISNVIDLDTGIDQLLGSLSNLSKSPLSANGSSLNQVTPISTTSLPGTPGARAKRFSSCKKSVGEGTSVSKTDGNLISRQPSTGMTENKGFCLMRTMSVND